jgi:prepilin-type processing-associated H-X9-DG protein
LHISNSNHRFAFTVIELVAIIVIVTVLFVLLFTGLPRAKQRAQNQQCVRILKSVGLAFRQWSIDNSDTYPMRRATSLGGSMESATNGAVFFTFVVVSNELNTPKILICPTDTRAPATNFSPSFGNANLSYFVGINADETQPQTLLMGDRNVTNGPLPPNRVLLLTTNSAPGWNHELHKFGGNVSLADGSVQGLDPSHLRTAVTNAGDPTLLAIP